MRKGMGALLFVMLAGCAPRSSPETKPGSAEAAGEVRAVVTSLAKAIEAKDLAALDRLYSPSPDLLVIEGGGADRGWANYRDHHLAPELERLQDLSFTCENLRVEVEGSLAWATCEISLRGVMGEKTLDLVGHETMVLRKSGASWQIVHSHSSTRPRKPKNGQ